MFSHDTEHSLETIVDLVNTDPAYNGTEGLADVASLQDFMAMHRVSHSQRVTSADLTEVRALRSRFAPFFGTVDRVAAARRVNRLLAHAAVRPRLTDHDGHDWHMHYFAPGSSLCDHLAVDGAMALAHVIAADEIDRLRVCEAPSCRAVLLDLSRNRSKRYCDASTCGNRLHVAAYRERKRSAQLAGSA